MFNFYYFNEFGSWSAYFAYTPSSILIHQQENIQLYMEMEIHFSGCWGGPIYASLPFSYSCVPLNIVNLTTYYTRPIRCHENILSDSTQLLNQVFANIHNATKNILSRFASIILNLIGLLKCLLSSIINRWPPRYNYLISCIPMK